MHTRMRTRTLAGDYLFQEGDKNRQMYFIRKGEVGVETYDSFGTAGLVAVLGRWWCLC